MFPNLHDIMDSKLSLLIAFSRSPKYPYNVYEVDFHIHVYTKWEVHDFYQDQVNKLDMYLHDQL